MTRNGFGALLSVDVDKLNYLLKLRPIELAGAPVQRCSCACQVPTTAMSCFRMESFSAGKSLDRTSCHLSSSACSCLLSSPKTSSSARVVDCLRR